MERFKVTIQGQRRVRFDLSSVLGLVDVVTAISFLLLSRADHRTQASPWEFYFLANRRERSSSILSRYSTNLA